MGTENVGAQPRQLQQQNPNSGNARTIRSVKGAQLALQATKARYTAGSLRDGADAFIRGAQANPFEAPVEEMNQEDLERTSLIKEVNKQKLQETHKKANKTAQGIVLRLSAEEVAEKALDKLPKLSKFLSKGTQEGQTPQVQRELVEGNIEKMLEDPSGMVPIFEATTLKNLKKELEKARKEGDTKTEEQLTELEASLSNLFGIFETDVNGEGSHVALLEQLEVMDYSTMSPEIKAQIEEYEADLNKVVEVEHANLQGIQQIENSPTFIAGVGQKGDKGHRTFMAKLGAILADDKGGVLNFNEEEITWHLDTYQYKTGEDGMPSTRLDVKHLANMSEKFWVVPRKSGITNLLTNEQPMPHLILLENADEPHLMAPEPQEALA